MPSPIGTSGKALPRTARTLLAGIISDLGVTPEQFRTLFWPAAIDGARGCVYNRAARGEIRE